MPIYARFLTVTCLSLSLIGCLISPEETSSNDAPLNDEQIDNNPNKTLVDGQLGNDTLVPPPAPTLSISAAPGALQFIWNDQHNNSAQDITSIALYEFNSVTSEEKLISDNIDTLSTRYQYQVTSHTLAWNALSYRLEICSTDDCLSSLRMPIKPLLGSAATALQAEDDAFNDTFGSDVAINSGGYVAVVASPAKASALVFFNIADKWAEATVLQSNQLSNQPTTTMRIAMSADGDTIVLATIAANESPVLVVFDRLGENWVETATIAPNPTSMLAQNWNTDSLHLLMSDNGDRLAVAAHNKNPPINAALDNNNRVLIFDRLAMGWANTAALSVPQLDTRIPTFTASADLDRLFILSARSESLYLHEYAVNNNVWNSANEVLLSAIAPSIDNKIISNAAGNELVIAGWESDRSGAMSAVGFKISKAASGWSRSDSVRLPPIDISDAALRLASNASLSSLAIGWQSSTSANVTFYSRSEQYWQSLFSIPDALNLNRTMPMVQSIAISDDNSTVIIGTTQTSSGGLVSIFE